MHPIADIDVEYISAPYGLHPNAVAYGLKSSGGSSRVKKFELIGRLMAQSLIDARMLDLPLSPLFHSWLIGDQARVGLPELEVRYQFITVDLLGIFYLLYLG